MDKELSNDLETRVMALVSRGEEELDSGNGKSGRKTLRDAYRLLPEPRGQWDIAFGILMMVAAADLDAGEPQSAVAVLAEAADDMDNLVPPITNVLYGRARYDMGDKNGALEAFLTALLAGGTEPFEEMGYEEYLTIAKNGLRPPADCQDWDDYEPPDEDDEDEDEDEDTIVDEIARKAGRTPLYEAIDANDTERALRLIAEGNDLETADPHTGFQPLPFVTHRDIAKVVEALLLAGATQHLAHAMDFVRSKQVLDLLMTAGAPVGESALVQAVSGAVPLEIVFALIDAGADPRCSDRWGHSLLDLARQSAEHFDPTYNKLVEYLQSLSN